MHVTPQQYYFLAFSFIASGNFNLGLIPAPPPPRDHRRNNTGKNTNTGLFAELISLGRGRCPATPPYSSRSSASRKYRQRDATRYRLEGAHKKFLVRAAASRIPRGMVDIIAAYEGAGGGSEGCEDEEGEEGSSIRGEETRLRNKITCWISGDPTVVPLIYVFVPTRASKRYRENGREENISPPFFSVL